MTDLGLFLFSIIGVYGTIELFFQKTVNISPRNKKVFLITQLFHFVMWIFLSLIIPSSSILEGVVYGMATCGVTYLFFIIALVVDDYKKESLEKERHKPDENQAYSANDEFNSDDDEFYGTETQAPNDFYGADKRQPEDLKFWNMVDDPNASPEERRKALDTILKRQAPNEPARQ